MGKYFTVEVKPTVDVAALAGGNIDDTEILFDWAAFDIPKGPARLMGITARYTGKNGVDYTTTDVELFWAKSIKSVAPGTLGDDGAAVDTFGWFPNIIGKTFLDASNGSNDGDLIMGNIITTGAPGGGTLGQSNANNLPMNNELVLQGEPDTGVNVGYDKLYVAAIAKGTHNWGASTMTVDGTMVTTSPTLTVADLSPILSGVGPGDVLRDEDGLLFGTVKSVDSATQITLEANLANASANDKVVYNTCPITLVCSFEK
jgi:hypothetical protein|tara:strand:- start:35 stop:811 length:777 start_codon:yes stop_codon:yes gene_type:complete